MKKKKWLVFLIVVLVLAVGVGVGLFVRWRLSLPPAGQLQIMAMKLDGAKDRQGTSFGSATNVTVSGGGGDTNIGRIIARDPSGKEFDLPYFSEWFEGAELMSARHYGATLINKFDSSTYDAQIDDEAVILLVYEVDGQQLEVFVADGTRIPYTEENGAIELAFPEVDESLRERMESLKADGLGSHPVVGWE